MFGAGGARGGEVGCGVSANEYSCEQGAQKNFGDLTPYLTDDPPSSLQRSKKLAVFASMF
jgi:hypothetical protein